MDTTTWQPMEKEEERKEETRSVDCAEPTTS